jgi:hypothetical protein
MEGEKREYTNSCSGRCGLYTQQTCPGIEQDPMAYFPTFLEGHGYNCVALLFQNFKDNV